MDAGCSGTAIFGVSPSISYKDDKSPTPDSSSQLMSDRNELFAYKKIHILVRESEVVNINLL